MRVPKTVRQLGPRWRVIIVAFRTHPWHDELGLSGRSAWPVLDLNEARKRRILHFTPLGKYMKKTVQTGAMIAAAVGALAMSGAGAAVDTISAGDKVHCSGINTCKGTSDCATAENKCKGQNVCKGHGFITTKASECLAKDGKIIDLNKK